ncbi:MAG: fluoride efflux transporter FluC [Planctomycetia bacterium]
MSSLTSLLLIGLAGAAGTLLRAGLTALATRLCGTDFPWGTLAVNLLGCFACGMLWTLIRQRAVVPAAAEPVLHVGLLGGLKTYSSFAQQATEMLSAGRLLAAAAYVLATNLLGIVAVWAGMRV